jgi:hypothetical protein
MEPEVPLTCTKCDKILAMCAARWQLCEPVCDDCTGSGRSLLGYTFGIAMNPYDKLEMDYELKDIDAQLDGVIRHGINNSYNKHAARRKEIGSTYFSPHKDNIGRLEEPTEYDKKFLKGILVSI